MKRIVKVLLALLLLELAAGLTPDGVALLELKKSLNVSSTELQTWNVADSSPCRWKGITCSNSSEFVEIISLAGLKSTVNASLSPSVGRLSLLTSLDISFSGLLGTIPVELGNLKKLKKLDLSGNNLVGTIPRELGLLLELTEVRLGKNKLEGEIPAELAACPALGIIDVSENRLNGTIPPVLYRNRMLQVLRLQKNNFTGDIGALVEGLKNAPEITHIDVMHNKLNGSMPPSLGNASTGFAALSTFNILINEVTGRIPEWLCYLPKLERLSLQDNKMQGTIPSCLGNASSLVFLAMSRNSLTGPIPPGLGRLQNLTWLEATGTSVNGTIPESLGNCSSLLVLMLGNTSLHGTIPATLGNLKKLILLDLSNNDLEGDIPTALAGCSLLTFLILADNRLSGGVPPQLANCSHLQQVLLQNNQLSGHFELDYIQSLNYLSIANNSFTGNIYKSLLTNPHLIYLDASQNYFVAEVFGDFDVTMFMSLRVLMLGRNQLQGRVPSWMWTFPDLQILDLSNNKLSGSFEGDFTLLQGFRNKDVIAKTVDTSVLTMLDNQDLALLVKGSTQLLSVSSWRFVVALNLAENNFGGPIPGNIGEFKILVYCNLSHNAFTGTIPPELGLLPLQSLDLSSNSLEGPIPEEFSASTQLSTLRLANNKLTGPIPSGTQMQGFNEDSYLPGNTGLCGRPLSKVCIGNGFITPAALDDGSENPEVPSMISIPAFVLGTVLGFVSVGAIYRACFYRQQRRYRLGKEYGLWQRP